MPMLELRTAGLSGILAGAKPGDSIDLGPAPAGAVLVGVKQVDDELIVTLWAPDPVPATLSVGIQPPAAR